MIWRPGAVNPAGLPPGHGVDPLPCAGWPEPGDEDPNLGARAEPDFGWRQTAAEINAAPSATVATRTDTMARLVVFSRAMVSLRTVITGSADRDKAAHAEQEPDTRQPIAGTSRPR